MIIENKVITCNNKQIASVIMKPQNIIEKAIGMWKKTIEREKVMIWEYKQMQTQLFEMVGIKERLGFIVLDGERRVIEAGVMNPGQLKFVKCCYFIETHPDIVININKGDVIAW